MRPPGHLVRFQANPSAAKSVGVIALVLASLGTAFGNLGLFSASEIQRTGNLVSIRKSAIQLVNETLTAKIEAETAAVTVTYEFMNKGADDDATVGFPVDLMPPAGEGTSYNEDHWQKDGLQGFRILDEKTQLAVERTIEEPLSIQDRPRGLRETAVKRRWLMTTLHFGAHARKTVRISYVVRCIGVATGFEHDVKHWKFSPRTFLYTFRPARGWGDGHIQKLDIAVDTTFLRQNRFGFLEIQPKPETPQAGTLRWQFRNRDLNRIPDLLLTYDSTAALFQNNANRNRLRSSSWRLSACGSTNPPSAGLLDGDPRTSWLAKPDEDVQGPCFELRPRRGAYLGSVAILNGKLISEREYLAHPRIRKLRVEYVLYLEEGRKRETFEQILPDHRFEETALRFPTAQADFLDLPGGPEGIIEDVKMTVLDLYPGTGSEPLAISDLYVFGMTFKR